MPYINMPLDAAPLSERTRNALMKKNNIMTINDLRNIKDEFLTSQFFRQRLKGVGRKGIEEIKYAIDKIKDDFTVNKGDILKKEDIEEQKKYDITNYLNSDLYIHIKTNKINGSSNKRYERKKPLNDYLLGVYQGKNEFDLEDFIKVLLSILSATEIDILLNRLLFLDDSYILPFIEIAKKHSITTERVRQIEGGLLKKINEIFISFSNTKIGIQFKETLIIEHKISNYGIIDLTEKKDKYINGKFFAYIIKIILSEKYDCFFLNKEHKIGDILLVYKKNIIEKKMLDKFFINTDKIYTEKRPEEKTFMKDVLISKIVKKHIKLYLSEPGYEYGILKYLGEIYQIFQVNGMFTLPQNKKDLKFLIKKELEALDEPIHFTKMYEIASEKYPQYKRTHGKIQHALMQYGKNVGNGLYVNKNHHMRGGTIGDIAEEYIKKEGGAVKYTDLINYVMKNKIVRKDSIETLLFDQDKQNRFVRLEGKMIGLSENNPPNIVKSWNIYKLDENIYEFLKKNNISEFTAKEIMNKMGKSISYQRTIFALNKLIENGKISFLTKGITNYYYVL